MHPVVRVYVRVGASRDHAACTLPSLEVCKCLKSEMDMDSDIQEIATDSRKNFKSAAKQHDTLCKCMFERCKLNTAVLGDTMARAG